MNCCKNDCGVKPPKRRRSDAAAVDSWMGKKHLGCCTGRVINGKPEEGFCSVLSLFFSSSAGFSLKEIK